ncbi:MAG: polyprenol monophosphomannose synthase [Nonlabens sp.]|nr:polyprenol monophosphomannose synthase [Nonlabens sp.]
MRQSLIIIPTYNEIENIGLMIDALMASYKYTHVLIIDDNSPDGTAQLVQTKQMDFPSRLFLEQRQGKLGLGTAYIHGFKWALGRDYEYIFEMDADFSHNPEDLEHLYDTCSNGNADLAIGSRYIKGVNVVNWPLSRILLSYGASMYVRLITGMPVKDATAGFVCYKASLLRRINLDTIKFVGYAFQIELKFKAWLLKANIVEVPVIFTDRKRGKSKMSGNIISEAVIGVLSMKLKSILGKLEL